MSRDHYVAQTYLEAWTNPANRNHITAYRKSDLKSFPCMPYAVCHEWEGDKSPGFLSDENALGEYRKIFEPHWKRAVEAAATGRITADEKFIIAGYWSNLTATTPMWRDLGVKLYEKDAQAILPLVAKNHPLPPGVDISDVHIEVDPTFVKAVSTQNLLSGAWVFYNTDWMVLSNDTDHAFLTSDNPSALIQSPKFGEAALRCLSLSPRLAVTALMTKVSEAPQQLTKQDLTKVPGGRIRYGIADSKQAKLLNRAIVQNALDIVFSFKQDDGVARLVEKHRDVRPNLYFNKFPTADDAFYAYSTVYIGKPQRV